MTALAKKILVVDDEAPMRSLLRDFFNSQGYAVSCAASGEAALRVLNDENSLCAVVADIRMVPVDGMELLKQIKQVRPTLPVLLFTAAGTPIEQRQAIQLGAAHYLHKPFPLSELKRLLEEATKK